MYFIGFLLVAVVAYETNGRRRNRQRPLAAAAHALRGLLRHLPHALLVALLLGRREPVPAAVGLHDDRGEALAPAHGERHAARHQRVTSTAGSRPRCSSSQSRYSTMRRESWMTWSSCTRTGTQRWLVKSATSSRSRRLIGTRTCSKSIPARRSRRATLPQAQSRSVGVWQR